MRGVVVDARAGFPHSLVHKEMVMPLGRTSKGVEIHVSYFQKRSSASNIMNEQLFRSM